MTTGQLMAFPGLLQIAHLCASDGDVYAMQETLVAECRIHRKSFLAIMPIRNKFTCSVCKRQIGEALWHLEDPMQQTNGQLPPGMWGTPAGRYFEANLSALHPIFAHGATMPEDLRELLSCART